MLHKSQEEIETHEDYSVFSFFLTTDYDFKQDILSFGKEIEVLEPKSVRDEIMKSALSILRRYGEIKDIR